jgi:hypothetical protein
MRALKTGALNGESIIRGANSKRTTFRIVGRLYRLLYNHSFHKPFICGEGFCDINYKYSRNTVL